MSQKAPLPILWSFRRCPYAMRARLAIAAAGITVELREILLRDKPAAFLAVSDKATVPVLQCTDDRVIDESRDIMLWALDQHDPEGWRAPLDADSGHVDAFFDRLDGPFKTHLDRYKYASRFDPDAALTHRTTGAATLADFDQLLASQPALSGAHLALLDFASLPFVRQFRIADPNWFDNQSWPHLHAWLGGFLDSARFLLMMQKYPQWSPDGQSIAFPPQP
jgi:glutathione S-transferase